MGNIYKTYSPPASDGGVYLKFEDGEPVRVRIASEPVIFDSEYKGNISTRYSWIVWNYDLEKAQVMTLPVTGYRMIAELAADEEDWGDPTTYNLKVKRTGTGKETQYSVNPSQAKGDLDENAQNEIKGLNLLDLVGATPSASKIQWLSDVIEVGRKDTAPKKDVIVEDIGDEPINLDDIPF